MTNLSIDICNKIKSDYRNYLEKLFYHNQRQRFHIKAIERMVEKYGNPKIIEKDGYLEMTSEKCSDSRSLFISKGPALIGVLIYYQSSNTNIEIIHIALNNDYSMNNLFGLLNNCIKFLNIEKLKTFSVGYIINSHKFSLED